MLKVIEAFAGIGSQTKALKNIKVDHKVVGIFEIDKYALQAYKAIHGQTEVLGDITKVEPKDVPDHDLFTYSFPCTNISLSGKKAGLKKGSGTESSLLWNCKDIIQEKMPKYLLMENVKNLVGVEFIDDFLNWLKVLEDMGYVNYWRVLNSKHYGIPQHRERVFCVSIRRDVNNSMPDIAQQGSLFGDVHAYNFPEPFPLNKRLLDILEQDVDEKYFLSEKAIAGFNKHKSRHQEAGNGFGAIVKYPDEIASTIRARYYKDGSECLIQMGCIGKDTMSTRVYHACGLARTITDGGGRAAKTGYYVIPAQLQQIGSIGKDSESTRVYDPEGIARTQKNGGGQGSKTGLYSIDDRIRRLTPREVFRLMGFTDDDFDKAQAVGISDAQLYKMGGNSIAVDVLENIFKELFKNEI